MKHNRHKTHKELTNKTNPLIRELIQPKPELNSPPIKPKAPTILTKVEFNLSNPWEVAAQRISRAVTILPQRRATLNSLRFSQAVLPLTSTKIRSTSIAMVLLISRTDSRIQAITAFSNLHPRIHCLPQFRTFSSSFRRITQTKRFQLWTAIKILVRSVRVHSLHCNREILSRESSLLTLLKVLKLVIQMLVVKVLKWNQTSKVLSNSKTTKWVPNTPPLSTNSSLNSKLNQATKTLQPMPNTNSWKRRTSNWSNR